MAEPGATASSVSGEVPTIRHEVSVERLARSWGVRVEVETTGTAGAVQVWADGHILLPVQEHPGRFCGRVSTSRACVAEELMILSAADGAAKLTFEPLPDAL